MCVSGYKKFHQQPDRLDGHFGHEHLRLSAVMVCRCAWGTLEVAGATDASLLAPRAMIEKR